WRQRAACGSRDTTPLRVTSACCARSSRVSTRGRRPVPPRRSCLATSKLASSDAATPQLVTAARARRAALWMLALTAACLPLYIVRWRVGPLPTTLLENLILLTVAAYAAVLWTEKRLPRARTPYDIPIALLLLAGVVGIVVAPDHVRALGIYRAYLLEAIAVFYIAVDMLRSRDDLRVFLGVTGVGAALFATGQIITFVWVAAHNDLHLGAPPSFLNTSANADAMYLEPLLAFAAAFTLFPSRPRERLLAAPVLALVFVAILTALSRASFLAMGVLAVVLVITAQTARWRLRAAAAFAIIFFGILWRAARGLRTARDVARPLCWGCAGAIVLYAVHGLFDTPYWKNDLSVLFWLVAALQVVAGRMVRVGNRALP